MVYSAVDCGEAGRHFLGVLFFVTSDFHFSVFGQLAFRVERSEDRKHVFVRRLNCSRDETKQTAIETT